MDFIQIKNITTYFKNLGGLKKNLIRLTEKNQVLIREFLL